MVFDPGAVLLAIQIGVTLAQKGQQIYVDRVRSKPLVLPLPKGPTGALSQAELRTFFGHGGDGEALAAADRDIEALMRKPGAWSDDEVAHARKLHNQYDYFASTLKAPGDDSLPLAVGIKSKPALVAAAAQELFALKQWRDDDTGRPPDTVPAVLAALIDAAITWFANDPRLLENNRPEGKALRAFLEGARKLDFANEAPGTLLADLLTGALDAVAQQPRLLAGGRKEEALLSASASALSKALSAGIRQQGFSNVDIANRLPALAQSLTGAVLRAAAETVLKAPADFFDGLDGPESAVIESVGAILTDLLLASPQGIDLAKAVSTQGLERLARGLFAAVAANPDVLKVSEHQQVFKDIVVTLAGTLATRPTWSEALPEVAAGVLVVTARHLDGLWKVKGWDVLVREAVKQTLVQTAGVLDRKLPLSAATMASIARAVLAALADNPGWVALNGQPNDLISPAVKAILEALAKQDLASMTQDDVVAIVQAGLSAAGARFALLLPVGGATAATQAAIVQVIGAVFLGLAAARSGAATDAVAWRVASRALAALAVQAALTEIAKGGVVPVSDAEIGTIVSVIERFGRGLVAPDRLAEALAKELAR